MRVIGLVSVSLLVVASLLVVPSVPGAEDGVVLRVGDPDEIRSRNPLGVPLTAFGEADDPATGIFQPVFSTLLLFDPADHELKPYIAKGIDADANGVFDPDEYGVFAKEPSTDPMDIVVYFDFNGVLWHDGMQMRVMDVLFSLHLAAFRPRSSQIISPLFVDAAESWDFPSHRQLAVVFAQKNWVDEGALPGDPSLRNALRFQLQFPYPQFYELSLGDLWLFPRHIWEESGGGRHPDFGRLIYPEGHPRMGQGIPANETTYKPFSYIEALGWSPEDSDVIGSGPFKFDRWSPGILTRLVRNDEYYVGTAPHDLGVIYDAHLARSLHRPFIDAIVFRTIRNLQAGTFALQAGEIDYLRREIPPEFLSFLRFDRDLRIWSGPDLGYAYLGYNMRHPWLGYADVAGDDFNDTGRPFRQAAAFLYDWSWFLASVRNFAIDSVGIVSPANTFWHNVSAARTELDYDLERARAILDAAHNESLQKGEDWWGDRDGDGWRELPGWGDEPIPLLVPQAEYEHARALAGAMLTANFQKVGLHVIEVHRSPMSIVETLWIGPPDFHLAISGWRIAHPDPDYLYPFYHCDRFDVGLNFPGYCDADFDRVIELSRSEMDRSARQRLIHWAQGVLMEDRPVEPLFHPKVIEATRSDRFFNWSMTFGTLWSYWSWIGIRPIPGPSDLRVRVSYTTAMQAGAQQRIKVIVTDARGSPSAGTPITLRILPEASGIFVESSEARIAGLTDELGAFGATYEAPPVALSFQPVLLEAVANPGSLFVPVQRLFSVGVFPGTERLLGIRTSFPFGDLTLPGVPLPIRVEILDEHGIPASDALVRATASPPNSTLELIQEIGGGPSQLIFTPPEDLASNLSYRISLNAEKPGYAQAHSNLTIDVIVLKQRITPSWVASDFFLLAGILVASSVVVAVVLRIAWSRQK